MIEALSYLPCHGIACTVGTYSVNQGLTIAVSMAFIIFITVIFGITVVPLHKYLCETFEIYKTITTIIFAGVALYIFFKLIF